MSTQYSAVLGNPVAHSLSPWIHTRFAQLCQCDLKYERILVALDDSADTGFSATIQDLQQRRYCGCNVTVPFKTHAFAAAALLSMRAQLARACNTLCFTPAGIQGDNTDGAGLLVDLQQNLHFSLIGKRILLLGAGGAAAGILGPLLQTSPEQIVLVNRSPDKAQTLCARHQKMAHAHAVILEAIALHDLTSWVQATTARFDLLINATASSLSGAALNLPDSLLASRALVYDMMYGAAAQPFLQWGAQQAAQTSDGLGMLVEQAAEAFDLWLSIHPPSSQVLAELRKLQTT